MSAGVARLQDSCDKRGALTPRTRQILRLMVKGATAGDVARMNQLQDVFRVHVVSGRDAVRNPIASASTVLDIVDRAPVVSFPLLVGGRRVERTATGFNIHQP